MTRKFLALFGLAALAFAVSQWGGDSAMGDHDDDDFGGSFCAPGCHAVYRAPACDFDDDDFAGHSCAPACHSVYPRYHHSGYHSACQPVHQSYHHGGYQSACQPVYRSSYYGGYSCGHYGGYSCGH